MWSWWWCVCGGGGTMGERFQQGEEDHMGQGKFWILFHISPSFCYSLSLFHFSHLISFFPLFFSPSFFFTPPSHPPSFHLPPSRLHPSSSLCFFFPHTFLSLCRSQRRRVYSSIHHLCQAGMFSVRIQRQKPEDKDRKQEGKKYKWEKRVKDRKTVAVWE